MNWFRITLFSVVVFGLVFGVSMALMPNAKLTALTRPDSNDFRGYGGGGVGGSSGFAAPRGIYSIDVDRPEVRGILDFENPVESNLGFGGFGGGGPGGGGGGLGGGGLGGGIPGADQSEDTAKKTNDPGRLLPMFYAPIPIPEEEELGVIHTMGETRGFYAAGACLADHSDKSFEDFLHQHSIGDDLLPTHMPRSGPSSDWARVGVISGIFRCLNTAHTSSGVVANVDKLEEKSSAMEQAILKGCVNHSDEFHDPVVLAQLLNFLDARWRRIQTEGKSNSSADNLLEQIPRKIGAAARQAESANWWQNVWASSLLATIGGFLVSILLFFIEKRIQDRN